MSGGFLASGVFVQGVFVWGLCPGGCCPEGFCPDTCQTGSTFNATLYCRKSLETVVQCDITFRILFQFLSKQTEDDGDLYCLNYFLVDCMWNSWSMYFKVFSFI